MIALGLDLSTKTGWAVLEEDRILKYGTIIHPINGDHTSVLYPHNYVVCASKIASDVRLLVDQYEPHSIVIEETNLGKQRYSQKILEFIHAFVSQKIFGTAPIRYITTSQWRKTIELTLGDEGKEHNKELKKQKDAYRKKLEEEYIKAIGVKELTNKAMKKGCDEYVKKHLKSFRSTVSPLAKGKITPKHLSVKYVNDKYNLDFKLKDNDIADAICMVDAHNLLLSKGL